MQLAIDSEFFTAHLPILVRCITKGAIEAVCTLLRHWQLGVSELPIIVRDDAVALKGFHKMGDGRIFLKNLGASVFNDDLSKESNFGQIHLTGQYLLQRFFMASNDQVLKDLLFVGIRHWLKILK